MKNRTFVVATLGLAALLVAGGLFASNMGFKLNYALSGPQPGPQNGTNTIALPYNAQTNITNAEELAVDIGGFVAAAGPVIQVQRYDKAANILIGYTGGGGTPFALNAGDGYRVQVNTDVGYIVVGSHDPSKTITLEGPQPGPQNGTNTFSYPYHSTSANAEELGLELGGFTGSAGPVIQIQRYDKVANILVGYTGGGGTPFALNPGEAYRIQVNANVGFIPSHY